MSKRISQKKLNGEILLMQTQLMAKLATVTDNKKETDQLGFLLTQNKQEPDALLDLISKSKNITQQNARRIEEIKKSQSKQSVRARKEGEGTFLTGLGLASQSSKRKQSVEQEGMNFIPFEPSDPNEVLKELITNNSHDDLQQLRRMIRQTSSNLEGCSRKLNKNKKQIMHMADRYWNEVPSRTLNFLQNYKQFESKQLEDEEYYGKH